MTVVTHDHTVAGQPVVEEFLRDLTKCYRALGLYMPNNPMYRRAVGRLQNRFTQIWDEIGELSLSVRESGLYWEGQLVDPEPDKSERISWMLYKDGVRAVTLAPGAEQDEILRFLQAVHTTANLAADADDDLLTLLWERDFAFIRYEAVELGADDVPALEPSPIFGKHPPAASTQAQLAADVAPEAGDDPQRPSGIVNMDDFDSTLYFLDNDELAYLKEEIDREYRQNLRTNVLSILYDIFELEADDISRTEIIGIIDRLMPHYLGYGDFNSVVYILEETRAVLERTELHPEQRVQLEELPDRLSRAEVLTQLFQSIDEAHVYPNDDELGALFAALGPAALETTLAWLPRLQNERARKLLRTAAERLARSHPEAVGTCLRSSERRVIHGALQLVNKLKLQTLRDDLGRLCTHEEVSVRSGAVDALGAIATPGALQLLERMVADPDRDIRIAAVGILAERKHVAAFDRVEAALADKAIRYADLSEKRAFFGAYAELGGDRAIPRLEGFLRSGFLRGKADPETRACAAMGLGIVGTDATRETLEGFLRDKDALVRAAVHKALQGDGPR